MARNSDHESASCKSIYDVSEALSSALLEARALAAFSGDLPSNLEQAHSIRSRSIERCSEQIGWRAIINDFVINPGLAVGPEIENSAARSSNSVQVCMTVDDHAIGEKNGTNACQADDLANGPGYR